LRRSGRVKCKGLVIEENTDDDAYSVKDDSSGDDFVKTTYVKGKVIELGKRVVNWGSVCFAVTDDNGKKGTKRDSGAAKKRKKLDIIGDDNKKDKKVKQEKGESSSSGTAKRKSKVADMNFKLNFIVLFTSVMGSVKLKGICDLSVLNKISRKTELEKINWCKYVWRCLKTCKDGWKRDMSNSFLGPITYLTMMYVDGTVCNELNVGRKRPPTSFWTTELLKERECEEIKAEGFGNGELQGPFVEEEGDPMPEDEDGFLWKLNKYVENIRKERNGFVRTFAAADVVLHGNTLIADVYQKYHDTLNYKDGISEGKSSSKLSGDNNEELHEVYPVQIAGDTASKDYDSPIFASGQATEVLFETKIGTMESTQQIESLVNGEIIDDGVVDAWCEFLNSLECLRSENSMLRFFLLAFTVDEAKANESVTKFLLNVEKVNERGDKKTYDSGVFLMRHMEAYKGNVMSKWECGLEAEECNLHRDSIRAQLNDIEVANVPGKRMKLSRVGK
nr:hypothetical protein [Tanacetum cinerariifolium]